MRVSVTVVAVTSNGESVEATATGTYQGIPRAVLEIRTASLLDETVIRFKNAGLVDLWAPGVWVEGVGTVSCPVTHLAPSEIATCTVPAGALGDIWAYTGSGLEVSATRR